MVSTVEELRSALEGLGLNTKGLKPELKQRYRKALKKQNNKSNSEKDTKEIDTVESTGRYNKTINRYSNYS